jgi:DNA-binding GntR family transcriptional regulator
MVRPSPLHPKPAAPNPGDVSLPRGEHAYRALRQSIKDGQLVPGTRLREVELAAQLGISRTPVREALRRLEAEGLATMDGGHGLIVTMLDQSMISELYVMREVLEGTAAALAARHGSEVELAILREIADRDALFLDDAEKLAANNRAFHEMLYRSTHNRYLLKTLSSLHESLVLLGSTTLAIGDRARTSTNEHQALVGALEQRDARMAEEITRAHIRAAYKARLSSMMRG